MLYNSMGISNYRPLVTEIYTNDMSSAHKIIENYHLMRADLKSTDDVTAMTVLFELLNNYCDMRACSI